MSKDLKQPTHNRLIAAFRAVGPYLREEQCTEKLYWFDCLSVCINDKKSPELREFWGWWMTLEFDGESQFTAKYEVGRYDSKNEWSDEKPQASALEEVRRTQRVFHDKLTEMLAERFALTDVRLLSEVLSPAD